jgi:hypothetical protein
MKQLFLLGLGAVSFFLTSCSSSQPFNLSHPDSRYLSSGTIVLSRQITSDIVVGAGELQPATTYTPILGYIPPMSGILPATNEAWLEINKSSKTVTLYRGSEQLKSISAQGNVPLAPGKYALQYKQRFPTWYAPDSYFQKRELKVPGEQDQSRYLKGALGEYALYPTTSMVIHSSPIWSEEIGGLRAKKEDIAELFSHLSLGSSIVVK